jgi:UDP-N-acetylmuramoyl-L-alanyl-D-glutamate--2,6-diaminopimelate ligase
MKNFCTPISVAELLAAAQSCDPMFSGAEVRGDSSVLVTGISIHAQKTQPGEMFVAFVGTKVDSHLMLAEAVDAGAKVLLVERPIPSYPGVTIIQVPSTRLAIGPLAHAFYGHPAAGMRICGVTGTNGKTTTTHIICGILRKAGFRPGLIGTIGAFFEGRQIDLNATTPGPRELARTLAEMRDAGVDAVVMECSSHAIDQGRLRGMPIHVGAILNVTQDHLDYHGTFEAYAGCKKRLFHDHLLHTPGSVSCFNIDDPVGEELTREYRGRFATFSREPHRTADVKCEGVHLGPKGTQFVLCAGGERTLIASRLIGAFNVQNLVAAATCAYHLGVDLKTIAAGINECAAPPGRFEMVEEGQAFSIVVDYAHTPDALERVLRTARRLCTGRIITVFGCGGDRDRGKRPRMGRIAGECSDFVIVTSDNPRSEDPGQIARQVQQGVLQSPLKSNRCHVQLDRQEAIDQAINMAGPGDMVMIAGKGHETYQEIGFRRIDFDDREVARNVLRRLLPTLASSPATLAQSTTSIDIQLEKSR